MAKTAVDIGEWRSLTDGVSSSVGAIHKIEPLSFSRTTLAPFRNFSQILEKFNTSISDLRSYTVKDSHKMYQVGKHKYDDDAHEAQHTRSQGGK